MTYLQTLTSRFNSQSHHAFVLHGATRDLQLGQAGSCSLLDHLSQTFTQAGRLTVSFRVGVGWRFAVESERRVFTQLVGLDQQASDDPFAALNGSSQSEDNLPLDVAGAIGLVDLALRQSERQVVVILDRAEFIAPNTSYDRMSPSDKAVLSILQACATDSAVETTRNMLILVTDSLSDLAESVRLASSRFYAVEIVPPDYQERLSIASQVLPQLGAAGVNVELSDREFASATSMMTRYGLMDIFADSQAVSALTKDQVRQVKQAVLSQEYGDILEMLDPVESGWRGLAGLDALKAFFDQVVLDMIRGNTYDVPAGVLLAGAAGLGKSYAMRCLAGQSGLPVINMNIGRILGSFVGQSERNLERALMAIRSAAPCLVVLDEIETTFPDRASQGAQGDSGVSSRILKRMLEELSNPANRGRVVWVGITNYPNKLDAALSRAGRFDVSVAFLPPTQAEIEALICLYAGKYQVSKPDASGLTEIAGLLAGYTNAEIENVTRKARSIVRLAEDASVVLDGWRQAVLKVRANTRDVQTMTDLALQAVNDSDLLPAEYVDRWRKVTGQSQPDAKPASQPEQATKKLF